MTNGSGPAHSTVRVDGATVHVVEEGGGSSVLLVHGFPETWWAFHEVMPLLSGRHRVIAVDLPGFGESEAEEEFDSARMALALTEVVERLDAGPVHLLGQDVSGALTYRMAATRPDLVASYTVLETVLPGFGFEALADVAHGGAWYIGLLAAPGVATLLLSGRERPFLEECVLRPQVRTPLSERTLVELTRAYRAAGFAGAAGLYRSLLAEGADIRALASTPLPMPVLALSGSSGEFVPTSIRHVAPDLRYVGIPDVGHYVALEAPEALASELLRFFSSVDAGTGVVPARRPRAQAGTVDATREAGGQVGRR